MRRARRATEVLTAQKARYLATHLDHTDRQMRWLYSQPAIIAEIGEADAAKVVAFHAGVEMQEDLRRYADILDGSR